MKQKKTLEDMKNWLEILAEAFRMIDERDNKSARTERKPDHECTKEERRRITNAEIDDIEYAEKAGYKRNVESFHFRKWWGNEYKAAIAEKRRQARRGTT